MRALFVIDLDSTRLTRSVLAKVLEASRGGRRSMSRRRADDDDDGRNMNFSLRLVDVADDDDMLVGALAAFMPPSIKIFLLQYERASRKLMK